MMRITRRGRGRIRIPPLGGVGIGTAVEEEEEEGEEDLTETVVAVAVQEGVIRIEAAAEGVGIRIVMLGIATKAVIEDLTAIEARTAIVLAKAGHTMITMVTNMLENVITIKVAEGKRCSWFRE